jgi:hypothetical protein
MIEELQKFKDGESLFKNGDFGGAELAYNAILKIKEYSSYYYLIYFKIGCCKYLIGRNTQNLSILISAKQYLLKAVALEELSLHSKFKEEINDYIKNVDIEINKYSN